MIPLRVYADTSVFGGLFDQEFQAVSRIFFDQIQEGKFKLVTSVLVQEEIDPAPMNVREFFESVLDLAEVVDVSADALRLRDRLSGSRNCLRSVGRRCAACGCGNSRCMSSNSQLEL
jgi:hypothetical protein